MILIYNIDIIYTYMINSSNKIYYILKGETM